MSLALQEFDETTKGPSDQDDTNMEDQNVEFLKMGFSKWFYTIVVRPYSQFIPEIVKKIYDSLELEEKMIEFDIEKNSKSKLKALESKKRKLDTN